MGGKQAETDSTNLQLYKVGKSGKVMVAGEDDEKNADAMAFKRLMAKMQEEAKPVGYMFGRGALDHDDMQYLKEQNQAEEDADRLRDQNEKRAFAAFRLVPGLLLQAAAVAVDSAPAVSPGAPSPSGAKTGFRVEPKPKSGIRQSALLQNIVAVRPKKGKQTSGLTRSDSSCSDKRQRTEGDPASHSSSAPSLTSTANATASTSGTTGLKPGAASEEGLAGTVGGGASASVGSSARAGSGGAASSHGEGGSEAKEPSNAASAPSPAPAIVTPSGASTGLESKGSGGLLGLAYGDSDEDADDT